MLRRIWGMWVAWLSGGEEVTSYLYFFDADACALGAPPSDIVPEDANTLYTIADAGAKGKVLKRITTGWGNKVCFFNTYNTFLVPVKMTVKMYIDQISLYRFAFATNLVNSANSGGYGVGLFGASALATARSCKYNTNAGLALDWWVDVARTLTLDTETLVTLQVRRRSSDGKQVLRWSLDNWQTWSAEVVSSTGQAQSRIGYHDWYDGTTPAVMIKTIAVEELVE